MQKKKNTRFNIALIVIAFIITIFAIINGSYIRKGSDIQVGAISTQKYFANSKTINQIATNRLIDSATAEVATLYTMDSTISTMVVERLDTFFEQLAVYDIDSKTTDTVLEGVTAEVYLTNNQILQLRSMTIRELNEFKTTVYSVANSALDKGIREESLDTSLVAVREDLVTQGLSDSNVTLAYSIISDVLEPNLVVDAEATQKAKEEKAAEIEPVMILENQKIVGEGEVITEEIYQILDEQGYIQNTSLSNNLMPILGVTTIVFWLFVCFILYVLKCHKEICKIRTDALLFFTIYIATVLITALITNLPYMFVPVLMFSMLISMLFNVRLSVFSNIIITFITLLIYKGDISFVTFFLISGTITAICSGYTTERNRIFAVGMAVSASLVLIMLGVTLFFDIQWKDNLFIYLVYAFLSGIITIIVVIGSLPIWESVFGIVTNFKLLELINPDKALMRRLMLEAPGTYHHSLIVSNLAEAAAYSIGANPVLARVGACYHDIGKLKNPQYFGENVTGESLHNRINPYDSAQIIINHVKNGIEIGNKYKLPQVILDIIREHHGTSIVKFFRHKAIELEGKDNVNDNDFRYLGPTPQSKESAVVMLADTVEAAVRSKKEQGMSMPDIETFVYTLIYDKLGDGQLTSSDLTMKDLRNIETAFIDIFRGMYHERVSYPEEKKEIDEDKDDK